MAASAFWGTTQKCTACEKTVYLVDQLTADNRVYHRSCFRCHHCKGTLKLTNYSSIDGVLYCKPHYDQLFKMTGSLDKSFEGVMKHRVERSNGHEGQSSSRVSSMFVGTQDKCVVCKKTVYPIEKVAVDGMAYHRPCFKCSHGGCVISPSNYVAHEGKLYCKHHHSQLFMAKGNFSQLEEKDGRAKVVIEKPPLPDNVAVEKPLQAESVAIQKPQQPDNITVEKPPQPDNVVIPKTPQAENVPIEKPPQPDNAVAPKTPRAENVSIEKPPQPDNVVAPKTPQGENVSIEKPPQPDNVVAPKTPQAENASIEKPPQPYNVAAEKPSPDGNGDSS